MNLKSAFDQITEPVQAPLLTNKSTVQVEDSTITEVHFDSGSWHETNWKNELLLVSPESSACKKTAIVLIENTAPAKEHLDTLRSWSTRTRCPVAVITDIPNQPLFERSEGELMAYSFKNFITSGDNTWPLLVPMTRAVRTGLNVLSNILPEQTERFILVGASKRAWTAYMTAATDPRVKGLVAMAFNALNFREQFSVMKDTNETPDELAIYKQLGLLSDNPSEELKRLYDLIDPFKYKDRLRNVATYIVSGTHDPYWLTDAWRFYTPRMQNIETFMAPNVGHDPLDSVLAQEAVTTWLSHLSQEVSYSKSEAASTTWYADSTGEFSEGLNRESSRETVTLEIKKVKTSLGTLYFSGYPLEKPGT